MVKVISLPYIFQVLYVLCFTRSRYQVSVYRTNGPLVSFCMYEFYVGFLVTRSVFILIIPVPSYEQTCLLESFKTQVSQTQARVVTEAR